MKTRIISAVIATVIAVVILFMHDTFVFPLTMAILTALMLYEIFNAKKCLKFLSTAIICYIFAISYPFFNYPSLIRYRNILIIFSIISVFITFILQYKTLSFENLSFMIASSLLITVSMNTLIQIKNMSNAHGIFYLVIALCGAWLADSGAYFAGTLFGKNKLCPNISPKKTIEGLVGGTIVNAILFILIGLGYTFIVSKSGGNIDVNYIVLAFLGVASSLLGLLGDLTASLIKRQCQIKDYGNIMPGHGGVLDRFDSILFVAPFVYLALQYVSIIK